MLISLYYYFSNKENIILSSYEQIFSSNHSSSTKYIYKKVVPNSIDIQVLIMVFLPLFDFINIAFKELLDKLPLLNKFNFSLTWI